MSFFSFSSTPFFSSWDLAPGWQPASEESGSLDKPKLTWKDLQSFICGSLRAPFFFFLLPFLVGAPSYLGP